MGLILDNLFKLAAVSMRKRGENTNVIEDPDSLWLRGDPKLIKRTNEQLRYDPET